MVLNFEYSLISVLFVSSLSLVGITTLVIQRKKFLDVIIHYTLSFAIGVLLATVFFELLPELVVLEGGEFTPTIGIILVITLGGSFLVEKLLNWHHHHHQPGTDLRSGSLVQQEEGEKKHIQEVKPYVYNVLIGDGIHNFIDGLVLAIAFNNSLELGFSVLLGVVIHEIAHEYGDFAILLKGGLKPKKALALNLLSALTAILGVFSAVVLLNNPSLIHNLTVLVLAITSGIFIYLSMADLLPELEEENSLLKIFIHVLIGFIGVVIVFFA